MSKAHLKWYLRPDQGEGKEKASIGTASRVSKRQLTAGDRVLLLPHIFFFFFTPTPELSRQTLLTKPEPLNKY